MKKRNLLFALAFTSVVALLSSCGGGSSEGGDSSAPVKMVEVSLADKGIPVTFMAPEGAEIKKGMMSGDIGGIKLISQTVSKDKFKVEVSMFDEDVTKTAAEYVAADKEVSSETDGYSLVKDVDNGYIYKFTTDGEDDYQFYYVIIKDNRAIEFSAGITFSSYSMEDAEAMMKAAQSAK